MLEKNNLSLKFSLSLLAAFEKGALIYGRSPYLACALRGPLRGGRVSPGGTGCAPERFPEDVPALKEVM